MKQLKTFFSGFLIALLITLIGGYFGYKKGHSDCQASWQVVSDSLQAIAAMPPDTIRITDTIIPEPEVITIVSRPLPKPVNLQVDSSGSEINRYSDSIVTDRFKVWIEDSIKGTLLAREVRYESIGPLVIRDSILIKVPAPYPVIKPSEPKPSIIITAGAGGNNSGLGWSLGMERITSTNLVYGAEYLRLQNNGYILGRIGLNF